MVLFYVGKLAWYPKGHLVSLGHFTSQLWKWPRGDVCACFLLDLQCQWDRIWKILSSRLQFCDGSFRPLISGLWGGFGMFVLLRSSRERERRKLTWNKILYKWRNVGLSVFNHWGIVDAHWVTWECSQWLKSHRVVLWMIPWQPVFTNL